ncbi:integrase catalytic domain-containing protein [Trichonephila clavipes]|nr:integrase catalytic domain-containing protein [Trichonephila clavipes]
MLQQVRNLSSGCADGCAEDFSEGNFEGFPVWEQRMDRVSLVRSGIYLARKNYVLSNFAERRYLNSRPLTPLSNDPQDLQPLTPGHFLIGAPMASFPDEVPSQPACLKKRWNLIQHLRSQFWKRWHLEYLNQLQQRTKWNKPRRNLKVNNMVLVKEDNLPPLQWSLGRVVKVFPGDDGAVRVVDVKTQRGQFRRPITRSVAYCQLKTELIVQAGNIQENTGPIEVLLGADVAGKLITGRREELKTGLVALETKLGWNLMGKVPRYTDKRDTSMNIVTMLSQEDIPVSSLWDLEMLGIRDTIEQNSREEKEKAVMSHFLETVRQKEDGRYEVHMPWKVDRPF